MKKQISAKVYNVWEIVCQTSATTKLTNQNNLTVGEYPTSTPLKQQSHNFSLTSLELSAVIISLSYLQCHISYVCMKNNQVNMARFFGLQQ